MGIEITKIRTPYDRAEKAGKEILHKAIDYKKYRKDWADKEIGQASKETATYVAGLARGRVSVIVDPVSWERIFRKRRHNA